MLLVEYSTLLLHFRIFFAFSFLYELSHWTVSSFFRHLNPKYLGAIIGMNFYLLKPDFSIVFDPSVWRAAATHVSYSLSIGFGGMISFASYIPRQHNSYKGWILSMFTSIIMFRRGYNYNCGRFYVNIGWYGCF
jgi:SNF family Na+-dependent transporter